MLAPSIMKSKGPCARSQARKAWSCSCAWHVLGGVRACVAGWCGEMWWAGGTCVAPAAHNTQPAKRTHLKLPWLRLCCPPLAEQLAIKGSPVFVTEVLQLQRHTCEGGTRTHTHEFAACWRQEQHVCVCRVACARRPHTKSHACTRAALPRFDTHLLLARARRRPAPPTAAATRWRRRPPAARRLTALLRRAQTCGGV
jgi:hypothetical protein